MLKLKLGVISVCVTLPLGYVAWSCPRKPLLNVQQAQFYPNCSDDANTRNLTSPGNIWKNFHFFPYLEPIVGRHLCTWQVCYLNRYWQNLLKLLTENREECSKWFNKCFLQLFPFKFGTKTRTNVSCVQEFGTELVYKFIILDYIVWM